MFSLIIIQETRSQKNLTLLLNWSWIDYIKKKKKIRIAISILYFKDVHKALSCFIVFIPKWYWNALHIDVPKKKLHHDKVAAIM